MLTVLYTTSFGFSTYAELLVSYQIVHVPSRLPRCSSAEDEDEQREQDESSGGLGCHEQATVANGLELPEVRRREREQTDVEAIEQCRHPRRRRGAVRQGRTTDRPDESKRVDQRAERDDEHAGRDDPPRRLAVVENEFRCPRPEPQ